jgi:hypothetical protein
MPTLPWVLPMYELMHEHLVKFMDDTEQLLAICEAACAGHKKLMYYYKMAMGVNARYCCYWYAFCPFFP